MVRRYCVSGSFPNCKIATNPVITLVMRWPGPKEQVTFEEYAGTYTLAQIKKEHPVPNKTWETPKELNDYIRKLVASVSTSTCGLVIMVREILILRRVARRRSSSKTSNSRRRSR
jgi:hypothetical protein